MTEAGQTGPSTRGEGEAEPEGAGTVDASGPEADAEESATGGSATGGSATEENSAEENPAEDSAAHRPSGKSTGQWETRDVSGHEPTPAAEGATADDAEALADQEDRAYRKELRKGLLLGLGGGLIVGVIVALVLGAFVWPGYLLGPGSPDDTAQRATAALAAKDATALDQVSCHNRTGQATTQLPAQALQLITRATASGPAVQTLDTVARAPVDLVVSSGGQTETLPTDLQLSVNDGSWCLNGLAQRQ